MFGKFWRIEMKQNLSIVWIGLLGLIIGGCSLLGSSEEPITITPEVIEDPTSPPPTNTPPPPPTAVAQVSAEEEENKEAQLLADLSVGSVNITLENVPQCMTPQDSTNLGVKVDILNLGSLPAGPFDVTVNGQTATFTGQIIPGDIGTVWVASSDTNVQIVVDPTNQVEETDETNNVFEQIVPIPTLPIPCTPTPEPAPEALPVDAIDLEWTAGGFAKPLFVTHAADDRLFVVEQQGTIRVITPDGVVGNTPFLNIIDRTNSSRNEQGLLGLAFHPDYQQNGRFFVNYIQADGSTVVSEFRVTADANVADPSSERQIITIGQPYANHNGGMISFGPDGYLYIGMGDGGSQNDPENRAQNLDSLLGKILRIDIDNGDPYGIPADNPFVNDPLARNEVWSFGWRNPWRFSFDPATGNMLIGDVGQNEIEEISLNPAGIGGLNFGWRIFEGNNCYLDDCSTANLVPAIAQYDHSDGHCSVTGGYMHRGVQQPGLYGNYFFADYCSSQIWRLFTAADGSYSMAPLSRPGFFISSFGEDVNGDVYVVNQVGGEIYKIVAAQ